MDTFNDSAQEVLHVRIRQVREGSNREAVSISGALPDVWHGTPAPSTLEAHLEHTMKASIITYMTNSFGVKHIIVVSFSKTFA